MTNIETILCPIDFSACSSAALDYALGLAKAFDAKLHVLHVYQDPLAGIPFGRPNPTGLASAPVSDLSAAQEERRQEIERLRRMCADHGVTSDIEEVEGVPAQAIVQVAMDSDDDLIVMGTHGRRGLAHIVIGSVAERVVRMAPCPVLTVRGSA